MHGWLIHLIVFAVVLFGAGNTINAAGALVAHWPFDGDGRDTSGNGNDATMTGDVAFVAGMSGQAVQFDAAGEYLQVPNNAGMQLLSGKGFSVAAYVKPDNGNFGNILIHGLGCSTWASWFLGIEGGEPDAARTPGKFVFGVRSAGGSAYTGAQGDVITNEWVHVAATHDGTTLKLYVNGQEQDSQSAPLPYNSTESLYLGGDPGCGGRAWYTGAVDEVYVFSRSMNAEQVTGLADGTLPAWLKAEAPNPADGATGVTMPLLQWSKGDTAMFHNVYVGTTPELAEANLVSPRQPFTMYYYMAGLQPGVTYYWRVDEVEASGAVQTGNVWRFTSAPATAYAPSPRNGDKWVATDVSLAWLAGQGATSHEVYFGAAKDAVANREAGVFQGKQLAPSYTPAALQQNTTYYWAVDEITGAGTKNAGDLWSFTTIGPGGGVKGEYFSGMTPGGVPGLTRIDPMIDFSWGNDGPGAPIGLDGFSARWTADLDIAIADSYTFIANSDDGSRLWLNDALIVDQWVDQGPTDAASRPMALEPGIYSLRMEYYENTGGAVAHLFWQSPSMPRQIIPAGPLQPPVRARAPYPAKGDVNVPQDVTLMWGAGGKAVQHQVYFGEDAEAVANATPDSAGIYKGEQALDQTSFDPGTLEWNQTYYWRVDEVNDASADSPWKGSVWSFTTADFIVVDDFESYNDEADMGTRIYETWIDGQTNGTTSTVGNWDPPFAERTIVHSGRQAMPMDYNNINSPFYAEAEREFSPLQNWTANGVDTLTLYFRGNQSNGAGKLYVVVEDSTGKTAVVVNPDAGAVNATAWTPWQIPLTDLAGVNLAKVKKLSIGVGDRNSPAAGGGGRIYIDDIRVTKP